MDDSYGVIAMRTNRHKLTDWTRTALLAAASLLPVSAARAQEAAPAAGEPAKAAAKPAPSASEIQKIIEAFAAKEAEFKRARDNYTYHQSIKVQEIDDEGQPMDLSLIHI